MSLLSADVTSPADPFLKIYSATCDALKEQGRIYS